MKKKINNNIFINNICKIKPYILKLKCILSPQILQFKFLRAFYILYLQFLIHKTLKILKFQNFYTFQQKFITESPLLLLKSKHLTAYSETSFCLTQICSRRHKKLQQQSDCVYEFYLSSKIPHS